MWARATCRAAPRRRRSKTTSPRRRRRCRQGGLGRASRRHRGTALVGVRRHPGHDRENRREATVEDLISVLPTVPSTWVPARPPPIPHTAHRPRRGVQSAVGEDRQPCAARALSSRANAASRACAVPGKEGSESAPPARQQRTGGRRRTRSRCGRADIGGRKHRHVRTRGRQDRGTGPSRPSVTVRATLQRGARAGTRAGEAVRERRNVRRSRPGHRLPPAGDDCPDTGDQPPGPVTATVDVGPGYLPGSPAPATVEDLISVLPTVPSTWVPARPPPIPHTAHRPSSGRAIGGWRGSATVRGARPQLSRECRLAGLRRPPPPGVRNSR